MRASSQVNKMHDFFVEIPNSLPNYLLQISRRWLLITWLAWSRSRRDLKGPDDPFTWLKEAVIDKPEVAGSMSDAVGEHNIIYNTWVAVDSYLVLSKVSWFYEFILYSFKKVIVVDNSDRFFYMSDYWIISF